MKDIIATVAPDFSVTVQGEAGFVEEHNAARLIIELNGVLSAPDITYHVLCFDIYGLGRKIVTNNIYGTAGEAPATRSGNSLVCPLPEVLTSTGELLVQVEGHRATGGDIESIVKSAMFSLQFEPSVTGCDEPLSQACGLLPRLQAVLAGIEAPGGRVVACTLAEYTALTARNPSTFYLVEDSAQSGGGEEEPDPVIAVTGLSLNKASLSLVAGGTEQLSAVIIPDNASNTAVVWSSDNPAVAAVDQNGLVTGTGAGTATITVIAQDGGYSAACTATVSAAAVRVTGITLNKSSVSIARGSGETLTVAVSPANAANKAVTWSSGNPAVATVSQNGLVTGIGAGTAAITAATADGGFTASCSITVTAAIGLWQGTKAANGITVAISGNHITLSGTKNTNDSTGGGGYFTDNLATLFTVPAAWYTFAAGTQITLVIANKTGTAACNGANGACVLRGTDNTILTGATWGTPAGTFTYTCTESTPVYGLLFYMQPGETASSYQFDVEFYVNGVRWI